MTLAERFGTTNTHPGREICLSARVPRETIGLATRQPFSLLGSCEPARLGSSGRARMTAMAEERLTEIPTSWTTISSAHTPGPKSQAAMEELVGRYHDAVTSY